MSVCHLKLKRISSFKAVTRKQSLLCRSGDPARNAHILVFEGEWESLTAVIERLKRLDPSATLCADCATNLPSQHVTENRGLINE
jgi:uncharacterized protein with PIN domain